MNEDEFIDRLDTLLDLKILNRLREMETRIMATLEDVVAADAALGEEVNQVIALVQADAALIAQLQGAIGSGNLSPQQQADVDNVFAQINAQHDSIVAALSPAAPPVETPALDSSAPIDGSVA